MAASTPAPDLTFPIGTPTLAVDGRTWVFTWVFDGAKSGNVQEVQIRVVTGNDPDAAADIVFDTGLRAPDGRYLTETTCEVHESQFAAGHPDDNVTTYKAHARWRDDAGNTVSAWSTSVGGGRNFTTEHYGPSSARVREAF